MRKKRIVSAIPIVWIISLLCMQSYADFQPERMYKVRKKISLNKGWKFKNDVPTSAPKEATYDDVPPGTLDTTGNEYPDFLLFSGLHRDVWLVCTDNVYISTKAVGKGIYIVKVNAAGAETIRKIVLSASSTPFHHKTRGFDDVFRSVDDFDLPLPR